MKTPAHEMALFIAELTGFGTFAGAGGWSTYVGREPLAPVDVITCYDTGGQTGSLVDVRKPSVQVRVRSSTYQGGWLKANDLLVALHSSVSWAGEDATLLAFTPSTDILFIGRDDKDQYLFTINFNLTIQTGV